MPRSRRRSRRSADIETARPLNATASIEPAARRWRPTAAVLLALCLGIWLGLLIAPYELPGVVAMWFSVIGAGLAGGRLLRRWLQSRRG